MEKSLNSQVGKNNNDFSIKKNNLIKIKKKLEELKKDVKSNEGTQELHRAINKIMKDLEEEDPLILKIQNIHDKMNDRIETTPDQLPEKYFRERNSLLTDLANVPHLRMVRSIFIVVLISLCLNAVNKDIIKEGKITLGYQEILEGMHNGHMALYIWLSMLISTVGVYGAFLLWGRVRITLLDLKPNSTKLQLWDIFFLSSFVVYCFALLFMSIRATITNSLQIMLSKIIIVEGIRFFMKTYAFVRSNVSRVVKYKPHCEDQVVYPTFAQFMYFSFAPTLIYRDSYPRTTHIRWNYVASCFGQFVAAFICLHLIQEYIVVYSFKDYDLKNIKFQDVQLLITANGIPSMFYFICWLFLICHASQNISAELLRFGDRLFYKDWWNATSIEEILSGWNVIVYDWFYTYIYKDMYEIVLPKNRRAAKLLEYCIMLMFHEIIYSFPYGFYYPVMFFIYAIGLPLISSLKSKNYLLMNSIILYSLTSGMGILRTSLMIEYYARIECPVENATLASYIIPRMYTCIN